MTSDLLLRADEAPGSAPTAATPNPAAVAPGLEMTKTAEVTQQRPRWVFPALLALLVGTGLFYVVGLTANGYANSFYSAAAQAGSVSWKAFFFGSFDASSFITVDKPPASLWVMALSVRVLGLNSFAILLPEVLMGIASVALVYAAVRRAFGYAAGLLAGLILALTPVAVLMFRFNNPDALLTLLMTLAAYATVRALEAGAYRWFALAGAALGFGFLTKTLQVLLVVPAMGLAWLFLTNASWKRRLVGSAIGTGSALVSAGWWVAIVELLPASARPYIGGSQTNSFLELTFGYNGLGRINGSETGSVGGNFGPNSGTGSLWRLFDSNNGGQISWLLPTALVLLVAGVVLRGRAPRVDARRAAYLVWGGWLVVTALTFSLMEGIYHEYYTVALAPAIAAVVAMGAREAWERRSRWSGRVVLAAASGVTAVWGFALLTRTTAYGNVPRVLVLALGGAAAVLFLLADRLDRRAVAGVAAAAVLAGLVGPAAYAVSTVSTAHSGSIVTAGPSTGGGPGGMPGGGGFPGGAPGGGGFPGGAPGGGTIGGTQTTGPGGGQGMGGLLNATTASSEVVAALSTNADQYRWVAAAVGSQNAAGLQLGTELPVMAIGGFNGSDPSPTLAEFKAYVAAGDIHYFLAGGGFGGQRGGSSASSEIATWVAATYTEVTIGGQTFYDLTQPQS